MLRRQSGTKAPPPPERLPSQDKYSSKRVLPLLAASIGCIVAASLILRTTMASALQTDNVVTCQDQHRMNGRAVPGTTLADDGHCVKAATLDAGVCVEDAADWRGVHRRRCLPSLAVIGARAASACLQHHAPPPRRAFALGTGGASMAYDNATFATATAYSCRRDRRGRAAATA